MGENKSVSLKKAFPFWLIPVVLFFAAGFFVAATGDLAINQRAYNPHNVLAIIMEAVGWVPVFMPPLLWILLWGLGKKEGWVQALGGAIGACIVLGVAYIAYGYLEERSLIAGLGDFKTWLLVLGATALFALLCYSLIRTDRMVRKKLQFAAFWGSVYSVLNLGTVQLLKMIWQRTRFDTMLAEGSFEAFTPWYMPFGNGGSSFPSGHTANAAGILALILLCDLFPSWKKRRKLVIGLCWGYIVLMAVLRIIIGRHFLSDTLASAVITGTLFLLVYGSGYYKKSLHKSGYGR